jgi:hypothetical protein
MPENRGVAAGVAVAIAAAKNAIELQPDLSGFGSDQFLEAAGSLLRAE